MTVVYVAAGSALGGVCRYFVSLLLNSPAGFPWGTLGVNVLGSLAIGLLSGWLAHGTENAAAIRAFAVVGFCDSGNRRGSNRRGSGIGEGQR